MSLTTSKDPTLGTCQISGMNCRAHEEMGPQFRDELRACYVCGAPVCRGQNCSKVKPHKMRNGTMGRAVLCARCQEDRR